MSTQSRLGRGALSRLSRLHAAQRARCFYCRRELRLRLPGEPPSSTDATIDHFFPRSQGGPDGWTNWVLACHACNNRKGSREPSPAEIDDWNRLAASWQYIRPIDPALIHRKRCEACLGWISPMRLRASLEAGAETRTCRAACGRRQRRARQQANISTKNAAQTPATSPTAETRVRMPRWRRLFAWAAAWGRRLFPGSPRTRTGSDVRTLTRWRSHSVPNWHRRALRLLVDLTRNALSRYHGRGVPSWKIGLRGTPKR